MSDELGKILLGVAAFAVFAGIVTISQCSHDKDIAKAKAANGHSALPFKVENASLIDIKNHQIFKDIEEFKKSISDQLEADPASEADKFCDFVANKYKDAKCFYEFKISFKNPQELEETVHQPKGVLRIKTKDQLKKVVEFLYMSQQGYESSSIGKPSKNGQPENASWVSNIKNRAQSAGMQI